MCAILNHKEMNGGRRMAQHEKFHLETLIDLDKKLEELGVAMTHTQDLACLGQQIGRAHV